MEATPFGFLLYLAGALLPRCRTRALEALLVAKLIADRNSVVAVQPFSLLMLLLVVSVALLGSGWLGCDAVLRHDRVSEDCRRRVASGHGRYLHFGTLLFGLRCEPVCLGLGIAKNSYRNRA